MLIRVVLQTDREAQRAIRERTKLQIESLERRIAELTSQQPYQELQATIRAKEAVEAENADIKRRLGSIVAMIQPLLLPSQGETCPNIYIHGYTRFCMEIIYVYDLACLVFPI